MMLNILHTLACRFGMNGRSHDKATHVASYGYDNQQEKEVPLHNPFMLRQEATELCEIALTNARIQLHPLLQQVDLAKLGQRREFIQAFRQALEKTLAERIAQWLPGVKVVYKFDAPYENGTEDWDNRIHLLILVPQLLTSVSEFETRLDHELLWCLKGSGWSRFQHSKSLLEIQQVTPYEMHHGVCYGAMFSSVYAAPVRIWPLP